MTMTINHPDNVARLYDGVTDNPNELNISRAPDGRVMIGIENRDSGNAELWINVREDELLAALAVTRIQTVSQDA